MEKHAKQYPVDAVLFTDDDGKAVQENLTDETKEEDPPTNSAELKRPEVVSVAVNTEEKIFVIACKCLKQISTYFLLI